MQPLSRAPSSQAHIVFDAVNGRTAVTRAYAEAPTKLLLPRHRGNAGWVYGSSYGGGFVSGDAVCMRIGVGEGAEGIFLTQAAGKAYRSLGALAHHSLAASVAERGLLVYAPDPLLCFAGAQFDQVLHFSLATNASLVVVDGLIAGRVARGERWQFAHYASRLTIEVDGQPVLADAIRLHAREGPIAARLEPFVALASIALIGPALTDVTARLLAPAGTRDLITSVQPLAGGVLWRAAATSSGALQTALREALGFLPKLIGDDPWQSKR